MKTYSALTLALTFGGAACTTDVSGHFDPVAESPVKIVGLFDSTFSISEMAVTRSTIYMRDSGGSVFSCPTHGCVPPATFIARVTGTTSGNAASLRASALGVFWAATDPGDSLKTQLVFCPASGCATALIQVLLSSPSSGPAQFSVGQYAVDDSFVYFSTVEAGIGSAPAQTKLLRCDPADCGGTTFKLGQAAAQYGAFSSLVVSDQTVYFLGSSSSTGGSILSCPTAGCGAAPRVVSEGLSYGAILGVSSGSVYYLRSFPHEQPEHQIQVFRCVLPDCADGPQFVRFASASSYGNAPSYAFAKGRMHWIDWPSSGGVGLFSCPDSSCDAPSRVKGPDPTYPSSGSSLLTTDGESIFYFGSNPFQTHGNGVMRLDL